MSFGANLKRERELRGISLDEIARETKISVRMLEYLEADRFDQLPPGLFRKSFIKSYAAYIGMDEEKVIQDYALLTEPVAPPNSASTSPAVQPANRRPIWVASALILLILAGVLLIRYWLRETPESGGSPAVSSSSSAVKGDKALPPSSQEAEPASRSAPMEAGAATPTAGTTGRPSSGEPELKVLGELAKKPEEPREDSGTGEASPQTLRLKIEATEPSWQSVETEGAPLYAGILQKGETREFGLERPLRLVLGNAGGVRLSINGRPFNPLGKTGEVRVLDVAPDNYETWLVKESP
ncbi:MAG: RodZ domain-containing protein [Acidobacteriota bacterium]